MLNCSHPLYSSLQSYSDWRQTDGSRSELTVRAMTGSYDCQSYMDDMTWITRLLQTAAWTSRLLKRFEELLRWTRMRIKPPKSRSLSIWKGARNDFTSFTVDGERISLLAEQPERSLGRLYTADLSDNHMPATFMKQLSDCLKRTDKSNLPGKHKFCS